MYKTVIFDFDGTVADSLKTSLRIFNQISVDFGLPPLSPSQKKEFRNQSARELIKQQKIPLLKLIRIVKAVQKETKKHLNEISPIKGMTDVFKKLKKSGKKIGIITSNSKENVQLFLKHHAISEIDFIHSESNLLGKAKVIKDLLKKQKLNSKEIIYIGDEVRDIEAAQRAGISVIAVTWGLNSKERLHKSKPDFLVSKPEEIVKLLMI
ncbi:HAD family hydrolase [Candidatus Microgenomates bacterium]|jgi:HAD superfamily hydrolase (TIGR01549 family)|nr:MAG: HAD family hydrolase [Candidatus Microgenomates bacterium]